MRTDDEREDEIPVDIEEQPDTGEDQEKPDNEADDELVVGSGDEIEAEDDGTAPAWARELRHKFREVSRENAELKAKKTEPEEIVDEDPGPKPKLADFDYDEDAFDAARDKWDEKRRSIEARKSDAQRQREAAQRAWEEKVSDFAAKRAELKRPDMEEAEIAVAAHLPPERVRAIIEFGHHYNAAALMLALGKSPARLEQLAKIENAADFVFALAKLSGDLKMTRRKTPPPPIDPVRGSAPLSGGDKELERLEREAAKSGDRTAVVRYKKQIREKQEAR